MVSAMDGIDKSHMVGRYRLHKTLGEGASSKVKLGINTDNGQQVAVKIMMPRDTTSRSDVDREISILKRLKHPHIVQLLDVIYDEPPGCVSFLLGEHPLLCLCFIPCGKHMHLYKTMCLE